MTSWGNLVVMIATNPSLRLQRLVGGSVAALLTANAFAIAAHISDDSSASDRLRRPSATGDVIVPTADTPPEVALITTSDGRTFLADPSTAEGRRAIREARQNGGTVRTVTVPPKTAKPGVTIPGTDAAVDLPGLVGGLLPGGGGGSGAGSDGDGLLEIVDPGLVDDLLDDPVGTATSVVGNVAGTVTSIVQSTPSTVTSVLDGATSTVSSIVAPVVTIVPTTMPPLPVPTTVPSLGLLGQVVTTVSSVVGSVTPTTVAPPPSPSSTPICSLLVRC